MICPYCDSLVRDVPDNRCCPNCGGPLGEPEKPKYPEPPLGIYKQSYGFMEIQEQGVRFYESYRERVIDRYIPYGEVYSVHFVPARRILGLLPILGLLSIREKNDKKLPLAGTVLKAAGDATSVIFGKFEKEQYEKAYDFFKAVCECNKLR